MTVDHRYSHLEAVRNTLSALVYPLQYTVNLPVKFYHWAQDSLISRENLVDENNRLRHAQLILSSRLQKFEILKSENERLRQLLDSSFKLGDRVEVAELLAVDMQTFRHTMIINKGKNDGAFVGQPVVDANGVLGQIIHAGPLSSTVLLITDPTHAIPVQINRNGLRGIVVGTGQTNSLQLEHLANNADVHVGDLVVSSGLGSRFPRGYPVGVVSEITLDPAEAFAKVVIVPSAHLQQSREVLLVWPGNHSSKSENKNDLAVFPP